MAHSPRHRAALRHWRQVEPGRPRTGARDLALGLATVLAVTAGAALQAPATALASPPQDDWSLETRADDAVLVEQRFAKLRKRPLDGKQWRALVRALGKARLAAKIERLYDRRPKDPALAVLQARALQMMERPDEAARVLEAIEPDAGSLRRAVFDLRVDALVDAQRLAEASAALEKEAERLTTSPGAAKDGRVRDLLEKALRLAERAGADRDALRLSAQLADARPGDVSAQLALARAARRNDAFDRADAAYERAIEAAGKRTRAAIVAERAAALIDAQRPGAAADLLWSLLSNHRQGTNAERDDWWRALEQAHRQAGTTAQFVAQLGTWLEASEHAGEVAAWRTLAVARASVGRDPIPAWEAAVEAGPRDEAARMGLIEALEAAGRTEDAITSYRALERGTGDDVRRGLAMAQRLIVNGERTRGLELADAIAARAGRDMDTLLGLLDFFNEHDETDRALEIAQRLVRVRPRDVDARIALGEQLFQMGRFEEALEQWNELPRLVRPTHAGWARLAQLLSEHASTSHSSRLTNLSMSALEKALAAEPDAPEYLRLRALLEEERREYLAALSTWQKLRTEALEPEHELVRAEARTRVVELLVSGVLRKQSSSLREAARREAHRRATAGATPLAREAGLFLAELYTREQRFHEAMGVLEDLVDAFPEDGALRMDLARAQRRAGKADAAMATLQKVIELDPRRRADALAELSELAYTDGDASRAMRTALEAADDGVDGGRALVRLGELHERGGDLDGARRAYTAALEAVPGDTRVMIRIADLDLRAGDTRQAAARFREILQSGGPPEVLAAAAQRALDLAEVTGTTGELLDLAVAGTLRAPDDDQARTFLLDVLDRTYADQIERWMRGDEKQRRRSPERVGLLRTPLVAALTRGGIGDRLRAAQHLGHLQFEETAVPLARLGVSLATPRGASRTVRDAYDDTRVTALLAAGRLDDEAAIPWLERAMARRGPAPPRLAATWALASSDHASAHALLRDRIDQLNAREITLACLGLSRGVDAAKRAPDSAAVDRIAHDAREPSVTQACSFAAARLTPDGRLNRLVAQFDDPVPLVAAAAAWRVGLASRDALDDAVIVALWRLYLGPRGIARDAAARSLGRVYGGTDDRDLPLPTLPTLGDDRAWSAAVHRWLVDVVTAPAEPVNVSSVQPDASLIATALRRLAEGTPAERAAARRAMGPCDGADGALRDATATPSDAAQICAGPLVVDDTGATTAIAVEGR